MNVRINRKLVKLLLVEKEMSLRDLARVSDIGEATIYRIVSGAPFTSETLTKLAAALDCNPVDLIESEGFPPPHMDAPIARLAHA